jgi:hypothetical protein
MPNAIAGELIGEGKEIGFILVILIIITTGLVVINTPKTIDCV